MGCAGAHCDHEVEAGHQRGGFDEIGQVGRVIDDVGARAEQRLVVGSRILLQAD